MYNSYGQSVNLDRINSQIQELERLRSQIQQPAPITQNFQIATPNNTMRYMNSIADVERETVVGDTPYFSKDMSVLWIKNSKGDIKTYELEEIVQKDEKDIKIEFLQAQIEELRKEVKRNESNDTTYCKSVEDKKSSSVSQIRNTKK